jgi:hypothetical protein
MKRDDWIPSPEKNLLWWMRTGCTLYRATPADGRGCYVVSADGHERETFEREVTGLERRGLIAARPRASRDEATVFEVTRAGMDFPL